MATKFNDKEFKDRLDSWQYRIFQLMLFIIFCAWVLKHLDEDLNLTARLARLLGF